MKKNMIAAASLAVAALAILSCAKEADVKNSPAAKGVSIQVIAGEGATKTYVVDGEIPTVEWSNTDYVSVFEVVDGAVKGVAESDYASIDAGKTSFKATLNWDDAEGSSYQYSAVYPAKSVVSYNGAYYIIMPDYQALNGNNFSANSDILFSTPLDHGADRVTDGEDLMFSFRRLGTVVRLTLNGIPAGEKIHQVTVNAPVNIAGAIVYDPATSTVDAKSAFEASASKTVTLGLNGGLEATGNDVVWFRVMSERAWAAGETASFEVITDKGIYKKEVTLPSDIKFPDGGLTKFGVGLASCKVDPVDVPFLWDFEEGADGWTFIDNDGDGYNWFPYAVGGISGNNSLVSQSYASSVLYPDNWAFSPAVQLTEDNYLSFWVKAYAADWPAEHYAVYIANDSPFGALTVLMPETVYPGGDYAELSEDGAFQRFVYRIPDEFAGQVVSFGFRHFNCYDQYALLLDDVEITEGSPVPESTIPYEAYLGEWANKGNLFFTVSPKEEGVSYSISGLAGQGGYELEAKFENHRLVLYDQVVASDGTEDVVLQGIFRNSNGYLDFNDFYEAPRVLLRAAYDDDNTLRVIPDNAYVGYVWAIYEDEEYAGNTYYTDKLPEVLAPYVPDETEYLYLERFRRRCRRLVVL